MQTLSLTAKTDGLL